MSKAFLKEDESGDEPILPRPSPVAPGVRTALTPDGAAALRAQLRQLIDEERPPLAAAAPTSIESRRELERLDLRIRALEQSLRSADVVPPPPPPWERVQFGAFVTVRDASGDTSVFRLVGVDETDADRGWISGHSPLGRALAQGTLGGRVAFASPRGRTELTIVDIRYSPPEPNPVSDGHAN